MEDEGRTLLSEASAFPFQKSFDTNFAIVEGLGSLLLIFVPSSLTTTIFDPNKKVSI